MMMMMTASLNIYYSFLLVGFAGYGYVLSLASNDRIVAIDGGDSSIAGYGDTNDASGRRGDWVGNPTDGLAGGAGGKSRSESANLPSLNASWRAIGHAVRAAPASADPASTAEPLAYIVYNYDVKRNRSSIIMSRFNVSGWADIRRTIYDHAGGQTVHIADGRCTVRPMNSTRPLDDVQRQIDNNEVDFQLLVRTPPQARGRKDLERGRSVLVFNETLSQGLHYEISWTDNDDPNERNYHGRVPYSFSLMSKDGRVLRIYLISFTLFVNNEELEIPAGVYCAGYKKPLGDRPLSLFAKGQTSLSFKAEIPTAHPVGRPARSFEAYFSWANDNLLYRVDFTRAEDSALVSIIVAGYQRVAFVILPDEGPEACFSVPLDLIELSDIQSKVDLFDPRLAANDNELDENTDIVKQNFYGFVENQFHFKRRDVRRGIPCTVYSVLRRDWPFGSSNTTLWEWCFHLGPESTKLDYPVALEIFKGRPGSAVSFANYSFYQTTTGDKFLTEIHDFDISGCFSKNAKDHAKLVFSLNVSREDISGELGSSEFLYNIHNAIVKASGMRKEESLRVQHVNVVNMNNASSVVRFTLLGLLSEDDDGDKLTVALSKLNATINSGKMSVKHTQATTISVIPGSLGTWASYIRTHEVTSFASAMNGSSLLPGGNSSRAARLSARALEETASVDTQIELARRPPVGNPSVAYALATLLFTFGIGVAVAEWYIRSRNAPRRLIVQYARRATTISSNYL